MFDDVPADELAQHQAAIATGALRAARAIASAYLAEAPPGEGLGPDQIAETLVQRDLGDPLYERLAPFEKRWAMLVIRLMHPAVDPTLAVKDALARGATWPDIADAIGTSRQTAINRFGTRARQ